MRQGCPLNMLIFALCINPILINVDQKIQELQLGSRGFIATVVAYADDITIIATRPEDIDIIQEVLHDYEKATGARINTHKSRAITFGSWDKSTPIMDIQYHDKIKILGFNMTNHTKESANKIWAVPTAKIRAQAQDVQGL